MVGLVFLTLNAAIFCINFSLLHQSLTAAAATQAASTAAAWTASSAFLAAFLATTSALTANRGHPLPAWMPAEATESILVLVRVRPEEKHLP